MQLFAMLSGLALSGLAAAAPAATTTQPASVPDWTFTNFSRTCTADDKKCTYAYGIDSSVHDAVDCKYSVAGPSASTANVTNEICGPFTINSSWNGQFGLDSAFTIISVTDKKYISWPSYPDKELADGNTVQPDRSFPVYSVTDL